MTEKLLQFIWRFQYLRRFGLITIGAEPVEIIFPGNLNSEQGPDFTDARIRIGYTVWVGQVEVHIKTSDWKKHQHEGDPHYSNVILHVVWQHDEEVNGIPVLCVEGAVPAILFSRYSQLMENLEALPCSRHIPQLRSITWEAWAERLVVERLERKSQVVAGYLKKNNQHWEETAWWMLSANLGLRANKEIFLSVANSLPVVLLNRHRENRGQLEALLLGQAGLLEMNFSDEYPRYLKKEYGFLKKKYALTPGRGRVYFLRMRPSGFPTIRFSQLAELIYQNGPLFSNMMESESMESFRSWLDVSASPYWDTHYRFDEPSPCEQKRLGEFMISSVLINTVAPILFSYGRIRKEDKFRDKAISLLQALKAESNKQTRLFTDSGITIRDAAGSQALIELKSQYCDHKKCLSCAIGNAILRG